MTYCCSGDKEIRSSPAKRLIFNPFAELQHTEFYSLFSSFSCQLGLPEERLGSENLFLLFSQPPFKHLHYFTCQSAQTSIPQPCILLHLLQLFHVQAKLQQSIKKQNKNRKKSAVSLCAVSLCGCGCCRNCCNKPDLIDGFIAGVLQPEVDHCVLECSAHVELQRQIVHSLVM